MIDYKPVSVNEVFSGKDLINICAPMVRYSRLPFRLLVREYGCDLAFTPMIIADSFVRSEKCREIEFITCARDNPLIVQFAAKTPEELADAAELVYGQCSGIDLNCGCPQRWAIKDGIGACMLSEPEKVFDVLRQTRNRIPDNDFSVSVKVRVFKDIKTTVDMVRQLESAGIDFVSVHGRTIKERTEPVRLDTIREIVNSVSIPVVANGDIVSIQTAQLVQEKTGARGVMVARKILENPAVFTGCDRTPISCIQRWIEISLEMKSHFTMFHRHLMHMTESVLTKTERRTFNALTTKVEVINWLCDRFEIVLAPDLAACVTNENGSACNEADY